VAALVVQANQRAVRALPEPANPGSAARGGDPCQEVGEGERLSRMASKAGPPASSAGTRPGPTIRIVLISGASCFAWRTRLVTASPSTPWSATIAAGARPVLSTNPRK